MGSPAFAPPDVRDVTLSLFGGRKTDIAPSDIPEGLTPDSEDGIYLPGEWQSRPGLARLYPYGTFPGLQALYEKTYVQPNGEPLNLILTSDGELWIDVGATPPAKTVLFSVTPGLYAQSVTAFGREYIAFSDLLHGQGTPLQYDGTFLDRVTMDGPGANPVIASNYAPAGATIEGPTTAAINIAASPGGVVFGGLQHVYIAGHYYLEYYTTVTITTTTPHNLSNGQNVTIAGSTSTPSLNQTWQVGSVTSRYSFVINGIWNYPATDGGGGTITPSTASLERVSNVVTASTASAHGFQPGWQVQIAGIANNNIGGGIASIARDNNGNVTVTTMAAHGLGVGDQVAIVGVTNPDATFNGTFSVASVTGPTTFTYLQNGTAETSTGASGNVQDIWNTTAFIQSVPSPTTFTYQQNGPNDSTTNTGTATILGQVSPGLHQFVVFWITRQGYLSRPSPAAQFSANGTQQVAFSNIPIGPPNVVARGIAFTGAGGDDFFTILSTPQVSGTPIGSALIIPDNTTTSAIFDFSDNTLFASIAIDQPGNDLFDQAVLGPVLGFFAFASRLACWGDYNKIENFLSSGFEGGSVPGNPVPLGWAQVTPGGTLVNGGSWADGQAWQIQTDNAGTPCGCLQQPAFEDSFGDAILSPDTLYLFRAWTKMNLPTLAGAFAQVVAQFYSPSTNFQSVAILGVNIANLPYGGYITAEFTLPTPSVIPPDMVLRIWAFSSGWPGTAPVITIDDWEIDFAEDPYVNSTSRWSYVDNPEAFALTTGNLGPEDDDSPIQGFTILKESALLATAEGVHDFTDNDYEPDEWNIDQKTRSIGALSLKSLDPGKTGTGDGAEDWALIADRKGVYLFAGGEFWKVSQEISRGALPQSQDPRKCWDDINWAAQQTIVAKNDPAMRRAYFAVPINGATTPNVIFVLDYREMDAATQIASNPPLHITIQGKMKSSDLTRKWSVWNIASNDLEILTRPGNQKQLYIAGGANAAANLYSLNPLKLTDDDYGPIGGANGPYYDTYAFTDHDQEQALGIGSDMHLVKRIHAFAPGVGQIIITPIVDSLYNFQPPLSPRILVQDTDQSNFLKSDYEWTLSGLRGHRIFFRISVRPLPGSTDVQLRLQKFIVGMMKDPVAAFRQSGI